MESKEKTNKGKLLVVVRISGMVKVRKDIAETLERLRLKRKYACVLVDSNDKRAMGMLEKVKHYVAFGEISEDILSKLIKERGVSVEKKDIDSGKISKELIGGKKLSELGLKPFFRLHPPRKGINSKLQYPKGVLGNNKDNINKLIERML